jgi:hypothetical protein
LVFFGKGGEIRRTHTVETEGESGLVQEAPGTGRERWTWRDAP